MFIEELGGGLRTLLQKKPKKRSLSFLSDLNFIKYGF
jgi:hypothetical protein